MSDERCERFRELASVCADERLEGEDLLALEGHLEACPPCREFESGIRRLRELLQAEDSLRPALRPPAGFAAAVMAKAGAVPFPDAPVRRPAAAWVGMALAAAAAAVFFVWSWQRLLPAPGAGPQVAVESAAPPAEEGSLEGYLRQHAVLARETTLLGSAEEIDFAAFHRSEPSGR